MEQICPGCFQTKNLDIYTDPSELIVNDQKFKILKWETNTKNMNEDMLILQIPQCSQCFLENVNSIRNIAGMIYTCEDGFIVDRGPTNKIFYRKNKYDALVQEKLDLSQVHWNWKPVEEKLSGAKFSAHTIDLALNRLEKVTPSFPIDTNRIIHMREKLSIKFFILEEIMNSGITDKDPLLMTEFNELNKHFPPDVSIIISLFV